MKRRDFLRISTQAAAVAVAAPVLAKTEPELKPILNEDGSAWSTEYQKDVTPRNLSNPLFEGDLTGSEIMARQHYGAKQWSQEQINIMRSRQLTALSINRIKK